MAHNILMESNLGREDSMEEIIQWLEDNKTHFTTYSPKEIADIAEAVGFDRTSVLQYIQSAKFRASK
jgi:AraC-like DNA-binding protein